ncbi:adenosine kinase [Roseomonas gilardii]|uniref:adenosine kinase n=1 Tax=Roseomonas gilardii TaxID=257708 RepID=UPI0011A25AC0|nr:adenosine kinase [Roseomonas gilardii]
MTAPSLDILGIGNAIVDVIARAEPDLLRARGLTPGEMRLIDTAEADALYAVMGPGTESSGGSAGNTCAVAAGLGAKVGYLGKVADDQLGRVFAHDMRAIGVHFPTAPSTGGTPTARCLILVTPDGQRTMNTYLGACVEFGPADVDEAAVRGAKVTYMEGYLFDPPAAQQAFRTAADIARAAGREVSITLSDPFCVGRHRDAFRAFVKERTDILFANETEILSLYETESFEDALAAAQREVRVAVLTRSEKGSIVAVDGQVHEVAAVPTQVVDTTGAGDAYAAGFLAAHTRGLPPGECGRWGSVAAAEVIAHFGARPQTDLKALIGQG